MVTSPHTLQKKILGYFFVQTKFFRINYAQLMCTYFSAHAKPNFFVMTMMAPLLRLSLVSMATRMEIIFNQSFCVRSFLLGSQGGASTLEVSPDSMDHWNQHANLGPSFFTSSFDCNFPSNIHCIHEKYTSTSQKGPMWFFPSFGRRKVMWSKFDGPEGVIIFT